ncbi:MAG: xanthine dehydrogenase family protein molybdopterin-binding subunit [Betaproteobacteria bacterium]|nr:xanthine dehydrogenase family protein molybdopterin-binding subunit [Betaproteobacteria bacterium]
MDDVSPISIEPFNSIGQPLRRREDARLLTGCGQFTDDFSLPGQAFAAMVRSPYPHARIASIVSTAALRMPGVLAVYTGADCAADGLKPIPHSPVPSTRYDMKLTAPGGGKVFEGPHFLLPIDRARHVGEAVAIVVALTREQAQDAAEAVIVDYQELPWITNTDKAFEARGHKAAAPVWDEVPDNVLVVNSFGDATLTDAAFARADHVVKMEFNIGRVTACTIEPRAALGFFDALTGRYTLYAGSGGAVRQKSELATVLGVDQQRVRVLSLDVGGNFGARNRVYVEFGLVLWASAKLGIPVKFTATRSEAFISDYQGRDLFSRVELALNKEGRFLALRSTNVSNVGARCASLSPLSKGAGLITGSYDIPAASLLGVAVFTNTAPTTPYRSSGRPEVTYAIERLVDAAADRLGIDRIELRRRNLVSPSAMPYLNAVGMRYDSGTYQANMDLSMKMADWRGFPARRALATERGLLLGLGLANYVESSIGSPKERAEVAIGANGRVRVVIGTQPSGQGHETSFAQVISSMLCIPVEAVDVVMGDTDIVSAGGGSHSGRSMRHAATVFTIATKQLIENGKKIAAWLVEAEAVELNFKDGRFSTPASTRSFNFIELAAEAARGILPAALKDSLAVVAENEMHDPVFPNGCAICEVEIDPDTGSVDITRYTAVDDVGRCINPLIVHGQTHGGLAQGVGQAMSELCTIDPASGQPLAGSFMDYGIPRADTLPNLATEIVEILSPTNPLGIKAGGEGGTTPAPAVVINAIMDALRPMGVRDITMPATPQNIWRAIKEASQ